MKKNSLIIWILAAVLGFSAVYILYNGTLKGKTANDEQGESSSGSQPRKIDEARMLKQLEQKIPAPDFSLKDLKGKTVNLSDYRGKIVFLNFWATWCPYCIDEMPDLEKAGKELEKQGKAVILAVNVQEKKSFVKDYVDRKKLKLPVLLDTDGRVTYDYTYPFNINGIPVTFIINPDGTIYNIIGGATDKDTILDHAEYIGKSGQDTGNP